MSAFESLWLFDPLQEGREEKKEGETRRKKKLKKGVFFSIMDACHREAQDGGQKETHCFVRHNFCSFRKDTNRLFFIPRVTSSSPKTIFFFSPSQSFLVLTFLPVYLTCLFVCFFTVFFILLSFFFFLSLSLPPVRQHIDARREILHWLFIARLFNAHRRGKKKSRREKKEEEKPCPQLSRLPMRRPT